MANKENLPPRHATPPISRLSPSHKPALGGQRNHSACRAVDSPLKVRKTRENLKQASAYDEILPPCLHPPQTCEGDVKPWHDTHSTATSSSTLTERHAGDPARPPARHPSDHLQASTSLQTPTKIQRQKSVSRRMLSRVKQGIASKSKSSQSIRPTGSETSLARRLSGRRKHSSETERRAQSFELSRDSIESTVEEVTGLSNEAPVTFQRSFTDSTVSTPEILGDLASVEIPSYRSASAAEPKLSTIESSPNTEETDPSPQPTPRQFANLSEPPNARFWISVPCVDLTVTVDSASVDVHTRRDVLIAIDATVRLKTTKLASDATGGDGEAQDTSETRARHDHRADDSGCITNLRLCYKPAEGCRIRNIIGQRSYRDLAIGQQCTLFIKLRLPAMHRKGVDADNDQDSLFAELESMVGTLKTDILHVEARYRHSLFPADNVVAVKHTCEILRPKTESRWSIIGLYEKEETASDVHARLAQYLADHYAPSEALELLHRYFDVGTRARPGLADVCSRLQDEVNSQRNGLDDQQPEVVITDIDLPPDGVVEPAVEHFDTAPSTPTESRTPTANKSKGNKSKETPSSHRSSTLAPPRISAPRTTTAVAISPMASSVALDTDGHESHDSAHQLWRHIRRASRPLNQFEQTTPDRLSNLETGDDSVSELRRRAIANKRSIGAETLRVWKWEEDMQDKEKPAEAPWM